MKKISFLDRLESFLDFILLASRSLFLFVWLSFVVLILLWIRPYLIQFPNLMFLHFRYVVLFLDHFSV